MVNIFQLKIALNYITPPIWRQVLVKSNTKLFDLHKIIQTTIGWTNSHLHQFIFNNYFYCNFNYEDDWDDNRQIDYSDIKLDELISKEKQQIIYEYNFNDGWEYTIEIEKVLPLDKNKKYPICLDGARHCPPEDCGGTGGYDDLLDIIKNPKHEEYDSMMEWLGWDFDPEYFNRNEIIASPLVTLYFQFNDLKFYFLESIHAFHKDNFCSADSIS